MRRGLLFVGLQLSLVALWFFVERGRAPEAPFGVERLDLAAPALRVEGAAGAVELAALGEGPALVHFWATWCAPCREELPGLIAAARAADVRLLAVTDEHDEVVAAFFGGQTPPEVVRDPSGEAARRFGVSGLPDTFVVVGGERIVARMGGPRDWNTEGAEAFLESVGGE